MYMYSSCISKLRADVMPVTCGRTQTQETGQKSCIMPGLPAILVQELKAGSVHTSLDMWNPTKRHLNICDN